jgi:hypothetical protein
MELKCALCGSRIVHECVVEGEERRKPLFNLFSFHIYPPDLEAFKASPYYDKENFDEEAPFFSEAFLYCLLGKEDARTVLAVLHSTLRHLGVDYYEVRRQALENLPCRHCEGTGLTRKENPNWNPEVYRERKEAYKRGEITEDELCPDKRYLWETCPRCKGKTKPGLPG